MRIQEHEFETAPGLPELLPAGERILWQGRPRWTTLAVRAFHVRKLAFYFAILLAVSIGSAFASGGPGNAMSVVLWQLPLTLFALGMTSLLAWLAGHFAIYTITDRRVVMRIGIVLTITFNIPLVRIQSADLRMFGDGSGDVALALAAPDRIAFVQLWPHVRPWRVARPEPMLRAVPDAANVGDVLARALVARAGGTRIPGPDAPVVDSARPQPYPVAA